VASAKHKREPISEDEQIARYRHLLDVLPRTVVESAHVEAFAELSAAQRDEALTGFRPPLSEIERDIVSEDREAFVALLRNAEPRDAMMHTGVAGTVASQFVGSAPVAAYFAFGGGSVTIDHQPLWIQELVDHESAPLDAGTMHHRHGVNSGEWFG
jgi:hypothetical protein